MNDLTQTSWNDVSKSLDRYDSTNTQKALRTHRGVEAKAIAADNPNHQLLRDLKLHGMQVTEK